MTKADKDKAETPQATPTPFWAARRAGVPIIGIETADPAATITNCIRSMNRKHEITPLLRWDLVRGLQSINQPGADVLTSLNPEDPTQSPTTCLALLGSKADKLQMHEVFHEGQEKTVSAVIFMIHANRWIADLDPMQAVWNCRDSFEPLGITLVLLGPTLTLPAELKNDVVIISEPLPGHDELDRILGKITKDAELKPEQIGDSEERARVVDTMTGTSAFGARQILAMSITKDGINKETLWARKVKMIESTPGLSVYPGGVSFDDLGGLSNLKDYLTDVLTSGNTPVRAIAFWDEIEKAIAGSKGDLSGTSQDQLQVVLKVMQDYSFPGIILVGHPGCGKSEIAKAAGSIAHCPTIAFDTGAMKDSLVGGSEARIRQAMEVFKAVSNCQGLFIATCNSISALPNELRRRFKLGTFFVDLPTESERDRIWQIWIKRFGLKSKQPLPDSDSWTGAEIAACCETAHRTGYALLKAAQFVTPIIKSNPEAVESLRKLAHNRFIDASKPGNYRYTPEQTATQKEGRKMEL